MLAFKSPNICNLSISFPGNKELIEVLTAPPPIGITKAAAKDNIEVLINSSPDIVSAIIFSPANLLRLGLTTNRSPACCTFSCINSFAPSPL